MGKNKSMDRKDRIKFTTIFYWVSGVSLLISIIAFCCACISKSVIIEDESLILIFVGILATFVVVGNYAQVKSIEQDFSQKVGELKYEFAEKVKELKHEFDKKVHLNQTILVMKEIYKKMVDSTNIAEELVSRPFNSNEHKELIKRGKENTKEYINQLNINRFILPEEVFSLFKEIGELFINNCFGNSIYITSINDNNIEEEDKKLKKLTTALTRIQEIHNSIDELFKHKNDIN